MSKIMTWCAGLALAGVIAGCGPSSAAAWAAGPWGRAIEVPGLGALNKGADAIDIAGVSSLSCASTGNCAAGGYYRDPHHRDQGFVTSEKNGVWGRAIEVPGLGALNSGGAHVSSVSCGSPGYCAAGGSYQDQYWHYQGFVVVERNGRWGRAIAVPGLGALNKGSGAAFVSSVSCGSAGYCAAGGSYQDQYRLDQGFVVVERKGRWGRAIGVPGLGPVISVSCPSAGSCAAVGSVSVVSLRHGRWGKAIGVPGLGALNKGGDAQVVSLSCASAGNCAVGGDYTDGGQNGGSSPAS